MKKELVDRKDIENLVDAFYGKALKDEKLGPFFNTIPKEHWEKHLKVMYNFWENVIFFTGSYEGNPMVAHRKVNEKMPMHPEHFHQWIALFTKTVDDLFTGEKAEFTKQRAISIATVMQIKLQE